MPINNPQVGEFWARFVGPRQAIRVAGLIWNTSGLSDPNFQMIAPSAVHFFANVGAPTHQVTEVTLPTLEFLERYCYLPSFNGRQYRGRGAIFSARGIVQLAQDIIIQLINQSLVPGGSIYVPLTEFLNDFVEVTPLQSAAPPTEDTPNFVRTPATGFSMHEVQGVAVTSYRGQTNLVTTIDDFATFPNANVMCQPQDEAGHGPKLELKRATIWERLLQED